MEETQQNERGGNLWAWIIGITLILIFSCAFAGLYLLNWIQNPRYDAPILADIDTYPYSESYPQVEARLLNYLTIGESTREEVEAFGNENLSFYEHPCFVMDSVADSQSCFQVNKTPLFHCVYDLLRITFIFEDDILVDIVLANEQSCL